MDLIAILQNMLPSIIFCAALLIKGTVYAQGPITLRVAMYPYVPSPRELFFKLEATFEAMHPGINLELVETFRDSETGKEQPLSWYYYDGGLLATEADIYEIDTVLLEDMVRRGKLTPLQLLKRNFVEGTADAVYVNGQTWAVPHWVCGNFIFYRKGDSSIEAAHSWDELMAVFSSGGHLLIDLKGRSTLGEWYLTSLAAEGRDALSILKRLNDPNVAESAIERLRSALSFCPAGYCRSEKLNDRTGFYARMFARGRARAYVGYSETLYYLLTELAESCAPTDGCITAEEIRVRAIPGATPNAGQVGWVDAFGISSAIDAGKRDVARAFVEFVTSWPAYKSVLEPEWPTPARYLLPAVKLADGQEPLSPTLYPALYEAYGSRLILSAQGLNDLLMSRGRTVDCLLPPERDDNKWQQKCGK